MYRGKTAMIRAAPDSPAAEESLAGLDILLADRPTWLHTGNKAGRLKAVCPFFYGVFSGWFDFFF